MEMKLVKSVVTLENLDLCLNFTLNHSIFLNTLDNFYKNEKSSFMGLLDI